jgi:hypothetical protein
METKMCDERKMFHSGMYSDEDRERRGNLRQRAKPLQRWIDDELVEGGANIDQVRIGVEVEMQGTSLISLRTKSGFKQQQQRCFAWKKKPQEETGCR